MAVLFWTPITTECLGTQTRNMNTSFIKLSLSRWSAIWTVKYYEGIAQLVRVPAWHAGGRWFKSTCLHQMPFCPLFKRAFILYVRIMYDFYFFVNKPPKSIRKGRGSSYSLTSGNPATLVSRDRIPARSEAEITTFQSTAERIADVPIVAVAVCAIEWY